MYLKTATNHANAGIYSNKAKQHTEQDTIALTALYLFVISVRINNGDFI